MDINAFLRVVSRYKWILICVPILAAVGTYFIAKELPKQYKSQARISTGIIDPSQQLAMSSSSDYFSQSQRFGNIMEMMKMKKMMSILSYNLILHDLEFPKQAFKEPSEELKKLTEQDKQALISIFQEKLKSGAILSLEDNEGKYKLLDLLTSMGYSPKNFEKKLEINRQDNSDFIDVEYTSENPKLSAFVVNVFSEEFMYQYGVSVHSNQNNSIALLDSLLREKEKVMNAKNAALKDFKMRNGVLNVDAQSSLVYGQISSNEELKATAIREIQSLTGAIAGIDQRLNESITSTERKNTIADNSEIVSLRQQIDLANARYIDNNFNAQDKAKLDELQKKLTLLMANSTASSTPDPRTDRQGLISQKRQLQLQLDIAKNSLNSINQELEEAKRRYNRMVPYDAGIGNYERDAEVATKEYLEVLNKSSQSTMESSTGIKLKLAQLGQPGLAEPGKTKIYMGVSAVSTFFFCIVILLIGFLLDKTVRTPEDLENRTGGRVLGQLNHIADKTPNVKSIWSSKLAVQEYDLHKELLRSVRFELDKDFGRNGCKILGITSIGDGVGKSFVASGLAYAFAKTNRKVLLIGDSESSKALSESNELIAAQTFEKYLVKREIQVEDLITLLNINTSKGSLFEIQNFHDLEKSFDELKRQFDIIIVDVASFKESSRAKEWLLFSDRILGVFKAGDSLKYNETKLLTDLQEHKGFMGWVLNDSKINLEISKS